MRAGSGIEHAEGGGNPPHINKHGFQLWINLPSTMKMDQPAYGTVQPEAVPELRSSGGGMSRFVAGKGSLALNDRDDFMIVDCELPANTSHVLDVPQHLVLAWVESASLPLQPVSFVRAVARTHAPKPHGVAPPLTQHVQLSCQLLLHTRWERL